VARGVYGGQIIGQALVAAGRSVQSHLHVHSMHCYFSMIVSYINSLPYLTHQSINKLCINTILKLSH